MKNSTRKVKISNNKMSFDSYIHVFAILEVIVTLFYTRFIATFSVYGDRVWLMVIVIVVFGGSGLILSWNYERNGISVITAVIMPILLYDVLILWKYSKVIRGAIVWGGIIALIVALCWVSRRSRLINRTSMKRRFFISKIAVAIRVVYCLVLLVTCVYGKILIRTHYTVSLKNIAYSISPNNADVPDYDNSLKANIATVAKLDPDGGWGELSIDEKSEVLETVVRVECRYLGMRDSAPKLELAYLEEGLLGQYDHEKDKVILSYNYVIDSNSSGYSIVQVLCHELYHRYQRYQVKLLEVIRSNSETERYANLLFFDDARIYEDEMSNYISPAEGSSLSYYRYYSQQLELDAEKYGNSSVVDYYEQIQTYLKTE